MTLRKLAPHAGRRCAKPDIALADVTEGLETGSASPESAVPRSEHPGGESSRA
jgi:hypothetical protein